MSEEESDRDMEEFVERARLDPTIKPRRELVFRSEEDMRRFLTPGRLGLLRLIRRAKPGSVYALAKLAGRDRKAVEKDLHVLRTLGLVQFGRARTGARVRDVPVVPYTHIDIEVEV